MKKGFLAVGHLPTLFASFFYFDMSFMVWVMLGPLGVQISKDLDLYPAQTGLMVAVPVLSGAALRIVAGVMVDRLQPKLTGIILQVIVIASLLAAWLVGVHSFAAILALGLALGVAGASFAVALPLASQWYPPEYQGTALGIAGAGNSGTVFAALFAPTLAVDFGWNNVFGLAALPLTVALAVFVRLARNSPKASPPQRRADYLSVLKVPDAWWLMFLYSVTFGGFVGLSSSLTIYFNDRYGLSPVIAGHFTAACVFVGSLVRPLGGAFADRVGGVFSLSIMYTVAAAALSLISLGVWSAPMALAIFVIAMLALGMGNGAIFQLVPQSFGREIGVITGLVGMAGGVGGFYLASSLGVAKQLTGSYHPGFLAFGMLCVGALVALTGLKSRWRRTWGASAELGAARI
ncbi:MAG TPA: nitrate/nitrite transporter [Xanthobacteraceae bacterium]|nr:nitrate/nitrite transporter [Xanthobacteraceae bacterium]